MGPLRVFVINMDTPNGRTRWPKMQRECDAAKLECERVVGVHGAQLTMETMEEATEPLCRRVCSPGMVGCALSHMRCWRLVVERNLPMALILEDDASLVPDFSNRLDQVLHRAPPEWHIITLGCFSCGPRVQKFLHAVGRRSESLFDDGVVRELRFFGGTHAYLVSQAGARHLLAHAPKVRYHIDIQMSLTPGLLAFGVHEDLAFQGAENATSALVSPGFPTSLNAALSKVKDAKGMGMDFYANAALARIGPYGGPHIIVTPLTFFFLILGVAHVPWRWVIGLSALDMVLYRPRSALGPASLLGAYGLGYLLRRQGLRPRWRG